jgi:hypothetical protein
MGVLSGGAVLIAVVVVGMLIIVQPWAWFLAIIGMAAAGFVGVQMFINKAT